LSAHIINLFIGVLGHALQKSSRPVSILVLGLIELTFDDFLPELFEAHSAALVRSIRLSDLAERILAGGHVNRLVLIFFYLSQRPSLKDLVREKGAEKLRWHFFSD
jgi:hypothetical protein